MTGLVTRLRRGAHVGPMTTLGGVEHDERCLEAADEIERLRAEKLQLLRALAEIKTVAKCDVTGGLGRERTMRLADAVLSGKPIGGI